MGGEMVQPLATILIASFLTYWYPSYSQVTISMKDF